MPGVGRLTGRWLLIPDGPPSGEENNTKVDNDILRQLSYALVQFHRSLEDCKTKRLTCGALPSSSSAVVDNKGGIARANVCKVLPSQMLLMSLTTCAANSPTSENSILAS